MGFVRSDVREVPQERSTATFFYPEQRARVKPLTDRAQVAAARLLVIAERFVPADRATVCSEWSIADLDLTLMLQRLALNGERLPEKLERYVHANWSRPSTQAYVNLPRAAYHDYG
jgi:glutathione S-transferase